MDIFSIVQLATELGEHLDQANITDGVHTVGHVGSNGFGGHDIYSGVNHVGSTEANVFGGHNEFNSQHHMTGHTEPNIFGGVNHFDAMGSLDSTTTSNVFGGQNLGSYGHTVGYTTPSPDGGMTINSTSNGNTFSQADFTKRFFG